MITSQIFQAAEIGLATLQETYPAAEQADEAMAWLGIGPRSLDHYFIEWAEGFKDEPEAGILQGFLLGVLAERFSTGLITETISPDEILSDDEPYEEAAHHDLLDAIHVLYGIDLDDDTSIEEATTIFRTEMMEDGESEEIVALLDLLEDGLREDAAA